jgi:cytochrome o ubiquinol oxidase subunit 3
MKKNDANTFPDPYHDAYSRTVFGFWMYLLTDFILFGTLFATYAVLKDGTYGGPSARDLFNIPVTLVQTLVLLLSSYTVGLAGAFAHRKNKGCTILFFLLTAALGVIFACMEYSELARFISEGHTWKKSAFLSSYFTLIGTYGVHLLFAILWVVVLLPTVWIEGLSHVSIRRLTCLKMFWQFLNIIWFFIFCFIYLMGVA